MRVPALVSALLLASDPFATCQADAGSTAASVREVAPPAKEREAILLSGKSANPIPESWLEITGKGPSWWTGPTGGLIVRNVSRASLIPFLPESAQATGAAMIVAPGGGTLTLAMELQGYQIARWLNARGIAAFVLKYRLVATPQDTDRFLNAVQAPRRDSAAVISPQQASDEEAATREDGIEAVRYVREHAQRWGLSADRIGFLGFSAGAFTALGVAIKADHARAPNLVAAIYGALPDGLTVPPTAPPVFLAAASDDPIVPSAQSLRTYTAWRAANVSAELHLFATGGHGFGIAPQGTSSDQ